MSEISVGEKVQEVLKQAGKPLTFEALLAACEVRPGDDNWTAAFDVEVMENRVLFRFETDSESYSSLVFYSGEGAPQVVGEDAAVSAIIRQLILNTDNRGDDWHILAPNELFKKQAQSFSEESIAKALQVGFKEKLFHFMSRSKNNYITVSLSSAQYYTVMAVEPDTFRPYCLYVRAGTEEVALSKAYVRAKSLHWLKVLSITEGRTPVRSVATADQIVFEELGTMYMPKY